MSQLYERLGRPSIDSGNDSVHIFGRGVIIFNWTEDIGHPVPARVQILPLQHLKISFWVRGEIINVQRQFLILASIPEQASCVKYLEDALTL